MPNGSIAGQVWLASTENSDDGAKSKNESEEREGEKRHPHTNTKIQIGALPVLGKPAGVSHMGQRLASLWDPSVPV